MRQDCMPLVTVVIPVYNHANFVTVCIQSIVDQTYRNIELIVINDGSKDGSHEAILTLVEKCEKRFVRFLYINRGNIGLTATLNQALSISKGIYFSILASDDVALPRKVEVLLSALEAKGPEYVAAFGINQYIDGEGKQLYLGESGQITPEVPMDMCVDSMKIYADLHGFSCAGNLFGAYETLIADNYLPAQTNIVKTEAIKAVGGWTNGNPIEDWEMWIKLAKSYKFLHVNMPVSYYRLHELNSIKTLGADLSYSSLQLIGSEKDYCRKNGFMKLWYHSYSRIVFSLLRDRRVPLRKKLSMLKNCDIEQLLAYIVSSIWSKYISAGKLRYEK